MGQLVFQATAGGQTALVGPNPSSNFSLNVPAVNGTLVTTGDTGTVTNTMLASNVYTAPGTIGSGTPNTGAFTSLSASSITDSGLTAGRVNYNGTGGLLVDSANMTFNGTTLTLANDASISGLTVGKGGGAVSTNTAVGYQSMYSNTTGRNTAFGNASLYSNTTGTSNTAIGDNALNAATTANNNTAIGYISMSNAAVTGSDNTAVGFGSLLNNTSGASNIAIGSYALRFNTTASNNTAVGYQAGYSNTTGTSNISIGYQAGYSTTTTNDNTALGQSALYSNQGTENTAVGSVALNANTTGNYNSAFGRLSLWKNTTGANNTGYGHSSLFSNTTASNNTAVGYQAGYSNQTGANNVFVGYAAGYNANTSGGHTFVGYNAGLNSNSSSTANTFFGNGAGSLVTSGIKNTIIGRYDGNTGGLDIRTANNYCVISDGDGNPRGVFDGSGRFFVGVTSTSFSSSEIFEAKGLSYLWSLTGVTTLVVSNNGTGSQTYQSFYLGNGATITGSISTNGTTTSYNITSDRRLKENIVPLSNGLSTILKLKPSEYNYIADPSTQIQGFIADELQAVVPHAVTGDANAVDEEGKPVYQGVDASFLIPHLVNAIQELNAKITALENK